jgi:hypothetical protein
MVYNNTQINSTFGIPLRSVVFLAVLLALVSFLFTGSYANNLPAVDIPTNPLMYPYLSEKTVDITDEELIDGSLSAHIPANPFNEPFEPLVLDPPADSYPICNTAGLNVQADTIATLPEVRQAVEIDTKVPATKKRKAEDVFTPIILKAANHYEVDPAIIKAIIMAESSYNPKAVSKSGAIGLMQLMPTTARALGVDDIFNPEQNINAGVRYFKQMLKRFDGDTALALAAYNAGSAKVRKYNGIPPYKATKSYIKKVFKYQKIYQAKLDG